MRLLLLVLLLHFSIIQFCGATSQDANQVQSSSASVITAKLPSRKNHGRTIEQLIGGHLLFNRDVYMRRRNKKKIQGTFSNDRRNKSFNDNNDIDTEISLITAGAGQGKQQKNLSTTKKEENKKTLSEQVAEGKYGLIHEELFEFPPKRPGLLSYKPNADVPEDDVKNNGGLNDEEIWLSEDHLLVLKGGLVNKNNNQPTWEPLDNYKAPNRQVKLPINPKVPPPFPVQLSDDGPIQFIGNNQLPVYNPFTNQTVFLFSSGRVPDIKTDNFDQKNIPAWNGEEKHPQKFNGYQYPPPVPIPHGKSNQTFSNPFLNLPPLNLPKPTGSIDEQNSTDIDEDDPSLYYPPPYSFVYKSNYSSLVSPGPLVPGIILPPPPNFFGLLEEAKKSVDAPSTSTDISNKTNSFKVRDRMKNNTLSCIQCTTVKPERTTTSQPIQTETQKYDIEIEKVLVKPFPVYNDTNMLKISQPKAPKIFTTTTTPMHIITTKKRTRTKAPPPTKTQLQKVSLPSAPPLISLNHLNIKGNPIYFEYFDARTSATPFHMDNSLTTVAPFVSSVANGRLYVNTTVGIPVNIQSSNKKRPPSKSYLPSKPKDLPYTVPDSENYRLKSIHEFNREIETIRQTLRLYGHSTPTFSSARLPKARPIYDYPYDVPQVQVSGDISQLRPYPSADPAVSQRIVPQSQKIHQTTDSNFRITPSISQQAWHPIVLSNLGGRPSSLEASVPYSNHYSPHRGHSLNVEITSANPHLEYPSFTTERPSYFNQPNWYSVEKVKVLEIPKPLIYNNGASGYNQKVYIQNKYNFQSSPAIGRNVKTPQSQHYNDNSSNRQAMLRQNVKSTLNLEGDILVNYKNPLPAIHPDSEILPYNGRDTKPLIHYHLPGNKANVYFISPQEVNYQ